MLKSGFFVQKQNIGCTQKTKIKMIHFVFLPACTIFARNKFLRDENIKSSLFVVFR